jgi:SAM-dependent methyltransferase
VPTAAYDEIADWYEQEFLANQQANDGMADPDPLGINHALRELLGNGSGTCLEIGCGTGVHAATVRKLGWTPVGVDLSAGMLRHARGRLATAQADAQQLPIRGGWLPAAIAVMVHTDMPGYPAVLAEAARVLRPGGVLLHGFLDAGLTLERFAEGGAPTPVMLAIKARKPPFCEHRPSEWLGAHEHLDVGDDATGRSWTTQLVDAVAALLRRPGCGDGGLLRCPAAWPSARQRRHLVQPGAVRPARSALTCQSRAAVASSWLRSEDLLGLLLAK